MQNTLESVGDSFCCQARELYLVDQLFFNVYNNLELSLQNLSKQINNINPEFDLWGHKSQLTADILVEKGIYYLFNLRHKMVGWLMEHSEYR